MQTEKVPKIAVLMATYNGQEWLTEQINSILNQEDVEVKLIVSDDLSTDDTKNKLERIARNDNRITILPEKGKFGSASQNFYRLIIDADINGCDYIAFSDQDDIWFKDKLSTLSKIANKTNADGVSSNVVAFWPDGSKVLINKAGRLRRIDFLFECSGPGCTFLMSPWLIQLARIMLMTPETKANQLKAHDWLMYTICRASGRRWVIAEKPTLDYRQHANNELGVHKGFKARLNRLQRLNSGWYKTEVIKTCQLTLQLTNDAYVIKACKVIMGHGVFHRLNLLMLLNQSRRAMIDRFVFLLAVIFNVYK